jgi:hypothetical protein
MEESSASSTSEENISIMDKIAKKIKLDEEQQVRGFLAILKLIHVPLQVVTP